MPSIQALAAIGLAIGMFVAFALSMIVNDTPVVGLLLPTMVQLSTQGGMPASRALIPIKSAVLVGWANCSLRCCSICLPPAFWPRSSYL